MTPRMSTRFLRALVLVLFGCGGHDYRPSLRGRFAMEASCEADRVEVYEMGAGGWRARGCGQEADYVCSMDAQGLVGNTFLIGDEVCARQAVRTFDDPDSPSAPTPTRQPGESCRAHPDCVGDAFCDPTRHVCSAR